MTERIKGQLTELSDIEHVEYRNRPLTVETWKDFTRLPIGNRLLISQFVTPLTGKGFLRVDLSDDQLKLDVKNHVVNVPRFLLTTNSLTNEPLAFVASEVLDIEGMSFYHLGGIIIDPDFQGIGLGTKLLESELKKIKPQCIVLRTQSKIMYSLAAKVSRISEELAYKVAPTVYPNNLDGNINRGVYRNGHSLYEKEEDFAHYAIDTIDWRNGDALVLAGYVDN